MQPRIDCLIAAGNEVLTGPQYIAASGILALAKALVARGRRTAILLTDRDVDPALVPRDSSEGIDIYRSSQSPSTLPSLNFALGQPRLLVLPNQLADYDILQTPGISATLWLGEDDLAVLGDRWLAMPFRLWADSSYVAGRAGQLTRRQVAAVTPPLPPAPALAELHAPDARCVAVVGARPSDGIALTVSLARQRRDLRFMVIDWPRLTATERQHFFAQAAACGNIDWRRPDGPVALLAALAEAGVILVPALQPIGDRAWIRHLRLAGRALLGSDRGAVPALIGAADRILPAAAPDELWLQQIDRLRHLPVTSTAAAPDSASASEAIAARFLADTD